MDLRAEVTRTLAAASGALTAREVRATIMDRTGHTVKLDTVRAHLRARTKLDGGADLLFDFDADNQGVYTLRPALTV